VEVILPKFDERKLVSQFENWVWLKVLNISSRNWICTPSRRNERVKTLKTEMF
jgi:hypothetical protein